MNRTSGIHRPKEYSVEPLGLEEGCAAYQVEGAHALSRRGDSSATLCVSPSGKTV
jgi:hypothetical protein